jgi:hypothetical protein
MNAARGRRLHLRIARRRRLAAAGFADDAERLPSRTSNDTPSTAFKVTVLRRSSGPRRTGT